MLCKLKFFFFFSVYKVGFIGEKGKATAKVLQRSPGASGSEILNLS
jgi:hypothetical protein